MEPVGLTLDELEAVDDDVSDRYAERTLSGYARLAEREIPLEEVVGQHVAVFLKGQAQGRRVSTVRGTASALAMVFDELDFKDNPALGTEVDRYLMTLVRRRREAPSQMDPFREVHYQAIVASAGRVLSCERAAGAELRGATDVALVGLMFDGMLRGGEAAQARWQDRSRFTDGSGSLLVPFSKTEGLSRDLAPGIPGHHVPVAPSPLVLDRRVRSSCRHHPPGHADPSAVPVIPIAQAGSLGCGTYPVGQ